MKAFFLIFTWFFLIVRECESQEKGLFFEISAAPQFTKARLPAGVGVVFANGTTEADLIRMGWHIRFGVSGKVQNSVTLKHSVGFTKLATARSFQYETAVSNPRVSLLENKYSFLDFQSQAQYVIFRNRKVIVSAFGGVGVDILLSSKVKKHISNNLESFVVNFNNTSLETPLNYHLIGGPSFTLQLNNTHRLIASGFYKSFLKEQYSDSGPGRKLTTVGLELSFSL